MELFNEKRVFKEFVGREKENASEKDRRSQTDRKREDRGREREGSMYKRNICSGVETLSATAQQHKSETLKSVKGDKDFAGRSQAISETSNTSYS